MPEIVSIVECPTYERETLIASLNKVLEPLGGWKRFIPQGGKVLLKPNFIKALPPERQAITHPQFLCAVAEIVSANGGSSWIGDSPAFGSLAGVIRAAGLDTASENVGIHFVPFQKSRRLDFPRSNFRRVPVVQEANAFDAVLNLPKLKAHGQLMFTGATKNLFGYVSGRWKAYQHFRAHGDLGRFALLIAELAAMMPPTLTIVDAVIGMEVTGPTNGVPYNFGVLIAATNCFALDLCLADLFKLDWRRVPILQAAHTGGWFNPDNVKLQVSGMSEKVAERFTAAKLPSKLTPISFSLPRLIKGFFRHMQEKFSYPPF